MVGTADWSIVVGVLKYIIAIVFAEVYYFTYKKIYLITFIASVATYIFAVFYTWDVFDPNKNWILAILAISTVIMYFLGKYFSKIELKPAKKHTNLKEKRN